MNGIAINERRAANAIEIKGVSKTYDRFALENIDITLPAGYVMGLIGENGAGKTTTIKALLGIIGYESGEIRLLGEEVNGGSSALMEKVGFIPDTCCMPESADIRSVDMIMKNIYKTWDSAAFFGYAEGFGLKAGKKVKEYSKGMKTKLSVAIALAHDSELLVLDEATGGLDPVAREELLDILREFVQDEKRSVLISSHILSDLEKICDYITFIHGGKVMFSCEKDALLEKYAIARCAESDFEALDKTAVVSFTKNSVGVEALVERDKVNDVFITDDATIEDIMIMFIREGKR